MPMTLINQALNQAVNQVAQQLAADRTQTVTPQEAEALGEELAIAQTQLSQKRAGLMGLDEVIATTRRDLEAARSAGDGEAVTTLEQKLAGLATTRSRVLAQRDAAAAQVLSRQQALADGLGRAGALNHLAPDAPVALLPVRLETRYFEADASHYQLRVRIFPDDIHIDQHQPTLQRPEWELTRRYWQTRLADGPEAASTLRTWEVLADQVGQPRARWLIARLDPYQRGGAWQEGDGGSNAPPIPSVHLAPEGWVDPPRARALPQRWAVVGYAGDKRVLLAWTAPVAPDLQMAPEPGAPDADLPGQDDPLGLEAGVEWLTDFQAAENVGMALRVNIDKIVARNMDRLLVVGVRASSPAAGAEELERLLAGHAATGLDFIAPGSPSNNTETGRSAYRARETDHRPGHQRLLNNDPQGQNGDNQRRTAQALGVDPAVFRHAWGAGDRKEPGVRALHTALWPTTVNVLLSRVLETPVTDPSLGEIKALFLDHVRSEGPLPCLRVGSQPYGLLPVAALDRYRFAGHGLRHRVLINALASLGDYFRKAVTRGTIPVLVDARDPQRELVEALTVEPTGRVLSASARQQPADNIADFVGFWQAVEEELESDPVDLTGTYGGTRLLERSWNTTGQGYALQRPLVSGQVDGTLPLGEGVNYIAALAAATDAQAVRDHLLAGAGERALLYLLLRSAWLEVAGDAPGRAELTAALEQLAPLPVTTLESLLVELVDGCAHRLDAWVTALADQRLAQVRQGGQTGLHIGGFGWVEGLQAPGVAADPGAEPRQEPDNAGFIHVPSLPQARTAALLHGAYLARNGESAETLAVRLTSDRVQVARQLLDGLRQEQSLGQLLGYRLERQLVDGGRGELIPTVRQLAPQAEGVLDGLELHRLWQSNEFALKQHLGSNYPPVENALKALDDALDALGDLLLTEGVHHAVNGNPARSAAAFDAMAEDGVLRVEPEALQTPVAGSNLTHRVAVVLPQQPAQGWPGDAARLRAQAEPRLNGWAAARLGAPGEIGFTVRFIAEDGTLTSRDMTLAGLDLCPLDLVALAGPRAEESSLVALLGHYLKLLGPDGSGSAQAIIDPAGGQAARTLEEALALAHSLQRLLAAGQPLAAGHLQPGGELDNPGGAELAQRATELTAAFGQMADDYAFDPDSSARWWRAALMAGPVDPSDPAGQVAIGAELARRRAAVDGAEGPMDKIQALLGREFRVLPTFTPAQPAGLAAAFADQIGLLEGDRGIPRRWLQDYARVRPGIEALDTALTLGEVFGESAPLQVGQLPRLAGQPWVGEKVADQVTARLSLVAHLPFALDFGGTLAGLLVDDFTESLPQPRAMTAAAFHYDAPKAQAPQAVLLALPPDPSRGWQFEDLEAALLQTLDLSRLRGITPRHLRDDDDLGYHLNTYLPAVYLSEDAGPDLIDNGE